MEWDSEILTSTAVLLNTPILNLASNSVADFFKGYSCVIFTVFHYWLQQLNSLLLKREAKKHNPGTLKALKREFEKKQVICTSKSPQSHTFRDGFTQWWQCGVMQLVGQGKRYDCACPLHTNLPEHNLLVVCVSFNKINVHNNVCFFKTPSEVNFTDLVTTAENIVLSAFNSFN